LNSAQKAVPCLLLLVISVGKFCQAVCPESSHQTTLAGYALSPDATRIGAVAHDGTLFWWDIASGKRTQLMECVPHATLNQPILFSPNSSHLAVATSGTVQVLDISTGRVIARLTNPKFHEIWHIVFSANGMRLAASDGQVAAVWEIKDQSELSSVSESHNHRALALNHEGSVLALSARDGIELRDVANGKIVRTIPFAGYTQAESLIFAHQDQWLVAAMATALPPEPKEQFVKYKREVAVWDPVTGKKLKTLQGDFGALAFPLATGEPDTLLAVDYRDHLYVWRLDSGMRKTWNSSSGLPSGDGKLLLREGGPPGGLELWEVGSKDDKARRFVYRSPLCTASFVDEKGEAKFDLLLFADAFSEEQEPIASRIYVAQDCTPVTFTHGYFHSPERAKRELERGVALATEILEKSPRTDFWEQVLLGDRIVVRFAGRGPLLGANAVIWVDGSSYYEIASVSLPVALAMERQYWEARKK
jgi:hypothetical protein